MKTHIEITTTVNQIAGVSCDFCNKEYSVNTDFWEVQEFHHIRFNAGYGSIFGDGNIIECDICQHCLLKLIEGKFRVVSEY